MIELTLTSVIVGILEHLVGHALYEFVGIGKGVEWLKGKGVKNPECFLQENNIETLRNHPDLKFYVPLNCAETIYTHESSLGLEEEINNLLTWGIPTVLLLGNSGSGKSTFCTLLSLRLIEKYQEDNNNPLPLFIDLGTSRSAVEHGRLIEDELERRFGLSPDDIRKLKSEKNFVFILDGYDELGIKENIYISNRLSEWKAKVIFTCRTQYLEKSKNYTVFSADPKSLKTLCIVPFSAEQVDSYLQKYAPSEDSKWKDWQKYKDKIKDTYNLQELATNPLLLRIITETLPIESGKTGEVFNRAKLYDGFFDKWFEKQGKKPKARFDFDEDLFFEFAEEIAFEMFLEGKMEIESPRKSLFRHNQRQLNRLLKVFTSQNINCIRARSGCPIQRDWVKWALFFDK